MRVGVGAGVRVRVKVGVGVRVGGLALVTDEDRLARARHRVVHPRGAVRRRGDELAARRVEGHVEDLVVVPAQGVDALARAHVPHLAGPVDGARDAELRREVELVGEMEGDAGRCREMQGDGGRCREISIARDIGRCREI